MARLSLLDSSPEANIPTDHAMKRAGLFPFVLLLSFVVAPAMANSNLSSRIEDRIDQSDRTALLRKAADSHLRFLYAMYFAIKGCTEAAQEFSKSELLPSVTFAEAKRLLANADAAAREVGIDVDRVWLETVPMGQTVAEALKKDTLDAREQCQKTGRFIRLIVARLQSVLIELGGHLPIIEKDFQ
ncbi:hypothetical protein [Xanthobacter versatilis]|uniref:hypothetical protein n=1 Tax=Xanthobacter autotrophicus (strain ATCC BAA-1158 / Py2) TaxID=78245 RepID=UPI0037267783